MYIYLFTINSDRQAVCVALITQGGITSFKLFHCMHANSTVLQCLYNISEQSASSPVFEEHACSPLLHDCNEQDYCSKYTPLNLTKFTQCIIITK